MKLNEIFNVEQELTLDVIRDELSVKIKSYECNDSITIHVLNYDQINSPKNHPVVIQCRGMIIAQHVEYDDVFTVYCRPFNRFFNFGECPETQEHIQWGKSSVVEKVDGSLIKVWFNYQDNRWEIATRGTAFGEAQTALGKTFRDLVLETIGMSDSEWQDMAMNTLDVFQTYLFEIIGPDNRIVTPYKQNELVFLAKVGNLDGCISRYCPEVWSFSRPTKVYIFSDPSSIIQASEQLPDLEEGYVVYDQNNQPVCKIKSPVYVAVHHIRGEGLTKKRIIDLVLTNEQEEYLTYYPEDRKHIDPMVDCLSVMLEECDIMFNSVKGLPDRKAIALSVKDRPYSSLIFRALDKGVEPVDVWNYTEHNTRHKMLERYHNWNNRNAS